MLISQIRQMFSKYVRIYMNCSKMKKYHSCARKSIKIIWRIWQIRKKRRFFDDYKKLLLSLHTETKRITI